MSSFLEFEGKTVEKAVQKACTKLSISKEKLKYDVISYGSTGIFGLVGIKKSKIRVTSPEPAAQKSASKDKRSRADKPRRSVSANAKEILKETFGDDNVPTFPEDPSELGKEVLQRIVDFITTDAKISVRETPERIFFNVEGGNTAVLIGKRGQTLEAIQYLVEKIINKHNSQRVRIQIDIEGYLDSRRAKLESLAARLSEKAKRIGKPVTIGQLNAHDRRIVHIALKDDSEVRTQSMGDGFYRKLVIFPQRRFHRNKETF
ncbi:RNA-binding cell elongation regulator Jag/EloR [Desulfobacterales bacterium HSG2]|nr:RNA-binding cell elongation regulator Jag/EloR [Desulfobacterales bacterium HSG2]